MTEFAAKLKESLGGVSARFKEAESDLNQEIHAASQDVSRISNRSVELVLRVKEEDSKGVHYSLRLVNGERKVPVSIIQIPWEGYPIRIDKEREVSNRQSIKECLNEMASNPESPLVRGLAYLMKSVEEVA